jgi:hypothetical protein
MRTMWAVLVVSGMLGAAPARGQWVVGPASGTFITAGSGAFLVPGRRPGFAVFGRATIIGPAYPAGFYGYTYAGPWTIPPPPPVIVVPPPIVVIVQPPVVPVVAADAPRVPDPARYLVIRPDPKPAPAPRPAPLPPPAPRVEKKGKAVELGIAPGPLPLARDPAVAPRAEADRQIESGRDSFAKEQFGRAVERFRQATALIPDDAIAWLMMAQAQFAIGKYDEAAASIAAGVKRQPDLPLADFKPRAMYRAIPFAFDMHLFDLRNALAAGPDDPRLLFLLGVQLWFDGRRDEAKPLFEKAAMLAIDPAPAQAFLKFAR